jgi:hypothetical protein
MLACAATTGAVLSTHSKAPASQLAPWGRDPPLVRRDRAVGGRDEVGGRAVGHERVGRQAAAVVGQRLQHRVGDARSVGCANMQVASLDTL